MQAAPDPPSLPCLAYLDLGQDHRAFATPLVGEALLRSRLKPGDPVPVLPQAVPEDEPHQLIPRLRGDQLVVPRTQRRRGPIPKRPTLPRATGNYAEQAPMTLAGLYRS